jgi:hypothetical protein
MANDILGLGGPDAHDKNLDIAPPTPASTLSEEEAKRHRRMNEGADEVTPTPTPVRGGTGGGTGIDMGPGGEGAGVE